MAELQNPNSAVFKYAEREIVQGSESESVVVVVVIVVVNPIDEEVEIELEGEVIDGVANPGVDVAGVEVVGEVKLEAELEEGGEGGSEKESSVNEVGEGEGDEERGVGGREDGVVEAERRDGGPEVSPFARDGAGFNGVNCGEEGEDVEEEVDWEVV